MITILKGMLIALSMLVPGVSGGTMMIILNVYTQTLDALDALTHGKFIHKKMMLKLIIGGFIGLFGFGWLLLYLLSLSKISMFYLFIGIVMMGTILLTKQIIFHHLKPYHLIYVIIGILLAISLKYLPIIDLSSVQTDYFHKLLWVLVGGIIIAIALILPGISTSYLLLVVGLYEPTLNAIKSLNMTFLAPMMLGVIVGILLTTRFLNWMLKHHANPTYLTILGFMIASISEIFPGLPQNPFQLVRSIILLVLGMGLMFFLERASQTYQESDE